MKRTTLKGYTKDQLIDYIECLEHNNKVLLETIDNQYRNATKLLNTTEAQIEYMTKFKAIKIKEKERLYYGNQ